MVSSRSADAVERAVDALRAAGHTATGMPCDVSDLAQVEALAAHAAGTFGRFDVWINNAGYAAPYGPTAHVPPQLFMRSVQTNIIGTYHGSIVALAAFLPAGKGKLINVLGRGSDGKPTAMQNAYAATKSWERVFTMAMAKEYKESGVGIFAINPGMMSTEMLTDLTAVSGYEKRSPSDAHDHSHVGEAARSAGPEGRLACFIGHRWQDRPASQHDDPQLDARRGAARRLAALDAAAGATHGDARCHGRGGASVAATHAIGCLHDEPGMIAVV